MTEKELLYVEDALGHESFMKTCCSKAQTKLDDVNLSNYINQLAQTHSNLCNKFLNLL